MLVIYKKILQLGGQFFDYFFIWFCIWNGEYIMLDISWFSFINLWSRKIFFIIGRYKVRVGFLNEDVFVVYFCIEEKVLYFSIQEFMEQIYWFLLQFVFYSGFSGYGSLGSNGFYEYFMSQIFFSDSNGYEDLCWRRVEIYKNGNKMKNRSFYFFEFGE